MNEEELNRLLGKYYSGDSTEEEEKTLRAYFSADTVPEGYETEKEIFCYYMASGNIPEPSPDLRDRILAGIDASNEKRGLKKVSRFLVPLLGTAAGILLLAGSYFFFVKRDEHLDSFKDPEIAYAETMKILFDVSSQLNRGAQSLQPVSKINEMKVKSFKTINKPAILVEKTLKSLNYLKNAEQTNRMPFRNK
jgi:hypothetical protein